jgi:hypothetical protein
MSKVKQQIKDMLEEATMTSEEGHPVGVILDEVWKLVDLIIERPERIDYDEEDYYEYRGDDGY